MTLFKLKLAAGVVLACGAVTAGGVWAGGLQPGAGSVPTRRAAAVAPAPPPKAERLKVDPTAPNPGKPEDPNRVADVAARRRDLNTLKQLGIAFHNHHDAYGYFPRDYTSADGKPLLSWRVAILPFIEQEALFRQFKLDEPWDSPHNQPLGKLVVNVYQLTFQPKGATDTYMQAFAGPGTMFDPAVPKMSFQQVTDGLSRTLMLMPVGPAVPWSKPADVAYHPGKPFPKVVWPYANTLPAVNGDGSAFHLDPKMTEAQLRQYIEVADGSAWPNDEFEKLRLEFPADTAAEKAEVRKRLVEAADDAAALAGVLREYLQMTEAGDGRLPSVEKAGEMSQFIKHLLKQARAELAQRKADGKK